MIGEEDWENAKLILKDHIDASSRKDIAYGVIKAFEDTNPVRKYKSDWKTFLYESKMEDFIGIDSEVVYVTTIHKAKGKEFDNVFLLLKNALTETDEGKRLLFVAMTRAKTGLFIHYNGSYLRSISEKDIIYKEDKNIYPEPEQIAIYLTHKDVQLWYFENVQHKIKGLICGNSLRVLDDGLGNSNGDLVLKYSQKFKDVLQDRFRKGFSIAKANVNFIVYWKNEEKGKEMKIILPQLLLVKR